MQVAGPAFEEVFRRNFKRVLTYWGPIGTLIGLGAAGQGLLSLYLYTRAIGRTDLFMAAIDAKSALAVWLVIVLVLMVLYLILLATTTLLFGLACSLFHSTPEHLKNVVVWLTLPVLAGFGGFILISYYLSEWLDPGLAMLLVVTLVLLACWGVLSRPAFKEVLDSNVNKPGKATRASRIGFTYLITFCLTSTVISGVFPSLLLLNAYSNEVLSEAPHFPAILNLLVLAFTLLPVVIFYCLNADLYKRIAYSVACALLMACTFLLMLPGAMSQITYKAAGGLEVRQGAVERYSVQQEFELQDLDPLMWKTRLSPQGRLEIQGFQQFLFGDALLICPQDLIDVSLNQIRNYTRYCIKVRDSKVTHKPPKPLLAHKPFYVGMCQEPGYWRVARRLDWGPLGATPAL